MKIGINHPRRQAYWAVFALFFIWACGGKNEETPVLPPVTSPLSQSYIGFGVVNVSYTRIAAQPGEENPDENSSPGYLRHGAVVRILRRQMVKSREKPESWVQVEDASAGWLREALVDIYNSEAQAQTASETMTNQ
ncbi:MAG: hypothetical protein LBG95_02815 [Treponema sp.]|jgi:hypothetical protein|nr:hypothetical protein [Treponema sp.]